MILYLLLLPLHLLFLEINWSLIRIPVVKCSNFLYSSRSSRLLRLLCPQMFSDHHGKKTETVSYKRYRLLWKLLATISTLHTLLLSHRSFLFSLLFHYLNCRVHLAMSSNVSYTDSYPLVRMHRKLSKFRLPLSLYIVVLRAICL